ncbi:MAG: hypothetical protein A4E53_02974 [Pelotomaculum sp. PtaB.Bin104]|nr:MAG: hypothetical protein A4E53_02974 [Pelotomaculum sp. PtaB.Bin104]
MSGHKEAQTKSTETAKLNRDVTFVKENLPGNTPLNSFLQLQQTIGNHAVQRILNVCMLQAKLKISQPNDVYEQEADRIANQVLRTPDSALPPPGGPPHTASPPGSLVRQVLPEEGELQTKPAGSMGLTATKRQDEEDLLQKSGEEQLSETPSQLESWIAALRGSGQPLPASARNFMEPRFSYDFSRVRVHTDARAVELAKAVNARAFTIGRDVVFGAGEYAPGTDAGKRLLAHEFTHVIQQEQGGGLKPVPLNNSLLENRASQAAPVFTHGSGKISVIHAVALGIARQPLSLNHSIDPGALSEAELYQEINLIRRWLMDNPGGSPEKDQLMTAMQVMENEVFRRQKPKQPATAKEPKKPPQASGAAKPAGTFRSIDVTRIDDFALEQEYRMVQQRLMAPEGYPERPADEAYLKIIEDEIFKRHSSISAEGQRVEAAKTVFVNYDSFCDSDGNMTDDKAAMRMISNWEQLDQVYQDADGGNPRAQKIIGQIENVYRFSGIATAERTAQLGCLIPIYSDIKDIAPRELTGDRCTPNWSSLNYLRPDKVGGQRLRNVVGKAFEERARELHVYDELIIKSLNLLMVTFTIRGALKQGTVEPGTAGVKEGSEGTAAGETKAVAGGETKAATASGTSEAVTGGADTSTSVPSKVWVGGGKRGGSNKGVKQPPVEHVSRPTTLLDEAVDAAIAERGGLGTVPKGKTAASVEGKKTVSGWESGPGARENTDAVMQLSKKIGHDLQPNKLLDQGVPGRYNACHAEKQAAVLAPNKPIAVSEVMCNNCRNFFQALARYTGKPQTVAEPRAVWIFKPDGSILVVPK